MSEILVARDGAVTRIQINRPDKRNALTRAMYEDLASALGEADGDGAVRALLVHAAGDTFTAGNDLRDFLEQPPLGADSPVGRFMLALAGIGKPVVAAVNGPAIGIGTTMLLHCDLVYAAEQARFHLPFVDLGLVPEFGSSLLLPALAGYHRAAELLLLARPFDAARAREVGLLTAVVPAAHLLDTAMSAAQTLAEKPATSLRLTRMLLKRGMATALESTIHDESRLFAERLVSPEAREAFAAFLARRPPDFTKID